MTLEITEDKKKGTNTNLSDKILSPKLLILLLLLVNQMMNTIFHSEIDGMHINNECVTSLPNEGVKQSSPARQLDQFTHSSFAQKELCVINCLK